MAKVVKSIGIPTGGGGISLPDEALIVLTRGFHYETHSSSSLVDHLFRDQRTSLTEFLAAPDRGWKPFFNPTSGVGHLIARNHLLVAGYIAWEDWHEVTSIEIRSLLTSYLETTWLAQLFGWTRDIFSFPDVDGDPCKKGDAILGAQGEWAFASVYSLRMPYISMNGSLPSSYLSICEPLWKRWGERS